MTRAALFPGSANACGRPLRKWAPTGFVLCESASALACQILRSVLRSQDSGIVGKPGGIAGQLAGIGPRVQAVDLGPHAIQAGDGVQLLVYDLHLVVDLQPAQTAKAVHKELSRIISGAGQRVQVVSLFFRKFLS